jgi:hypothetical protein
MTNQAIVKALVSYRLLSDQLKKLEDEQAVLKKQIEEHMCANALDTLEANGVVAQFVPRTKYAFDIPAIVKAVPEALSVVTLSDKSFMKLYKGHEALIGGFRTVASNEKTLTIRAKAEPAE